MLSELVTNLACVLLEVITDVGYFEFLHESLVLKYVVVLISYTVLICPLHFIYLGQNIAGLTNHLAQKKKARKPSCKLQSKKKLLIIIHKRKSYYKRQKE